MLASREAWRGEDRDHVGDCALILAVFSSLCIALVFHLAYRRKLTRCRIRKLHMWLLRTWMPAAGRIVGDNRDELLDAASARPFESKVVVDAALPLRCVGSCCVRQRSAARSHHLSTEERGARMWGSFIQFQAYLSSSIVKTAGSAFCTAVHRQL